MGGKGFGGKCYNCREVGHRKMDCPKAAASVEAEEEAIVDTVWTIAEVTKEDDQKEDWTTSTSRASLRSTPTSPRTKIHNKFQALEENEKLEVNELGGQEMTRMAQLDFNEADVRKPLASARFVAKAGNGIWLEANGGYIENLESGERVALKVVNDVYVFDVEFDDGAMDVVTLDSGAGCSVWPHGRHAGTAKMTEKKKRVGMVAANGTPIKHYGQRRVCFEGVEAAEWGFSGRM